MGRHSTPHGESSTAGNSNGAPWRNPQHRPKHHAAGSDVPARDSTATPPAGASRLRVPRWLGGKK